MALTHHEAQLVKSTIPFLKEHGESISDTVYRTLIERHPELNNTLNLIHLKDGRLARALTVVILRFASSINHISELIPKLERVCNKHCSLGIQPEHYEILGGLIIETFDDAMGPLMTPEMKAAWTKAYRILSNMMIGRERIIYKDFERYNWGTWRKFVIDRKVCEADGLYSFYLVPKDGNPLPKFLPGQYISVRLFVPEVGYYQTRQYSMSDLPRAGDYYRITVKRVEAYTCSHDPGMLSTMLIDRVKTGEEIECSHPSGEFFVDTSIPISIPVILISAGSGVGPLVSILNAVTEGQPTRHVSWIHGCHEDVPFNTRLAVIKRRCPNLSTVIFKTAPTRGDIQGITYDFNCRVDLDMVPPSLLHTSHGSAEYYICGPEDFMKKIIQQLVDMGIDSTRIKCELFSVGEMRLDSVCGYMTPSNGTSLSSYTSLE
ncbi:Flavohemoprotein [Cytospora mali]|uniref:nitric oxide dioxygenase n=1 Tax=Cytospora mali TaxID=578113 RepID=A0A194VMG1_CYTMA|nr:Flavohemoprotein [Valsa mali]